MALAHLRFVPGLVAALATAAALADAAPDAQRPAPWLELAHARVVRHGDGWASVPRVTEGGRSGIEQARGAEHGFLLRPPAQAQLALEPGAKGARPALRIAADGADGWQPAAWQEDAEGTLRASLAAFAERPIELRIANHTDAVQRWWRPRIEAPPALARPLVEVAPRPAAAPRPNVILYLVDTLRADRLSLYGYERDTSRRLERAAARALVFENAYAPGSFTTPSITALFGGLAPSAMHGSLRAGGAVRATLAQAFREAGYRTVAFQANPRLVAPLGYARGFEQWTVLQHGDPSDPIIAKAEEVQTAALTWLDAPRGDAPFFLYLQTMDVHFPYDPPPPFSGRYAPPFEARLARLTPEERRVIDANRERFRLLDPEQYDAAVAYTDHMIGAFLEALRARGLDKDTIVAITSDHGEPLGQRGDLVHGLSLHEELVRIPLVLFVRGTRPRAACSPWSASGTSVRRCSSSPPGATARSLLAARDPRTPPFAFGEQLDFEATRTLAWYVREDRWKLILDGAGPHLYDLDADPGETRDVRAAHPVRALQLEALVRSHSPALQPGAAQATPADSVLSEQERRELDARLRALGYAE